MVLYAFFFFFFDADPRGVKGNASRRVGFRNKSSVGSVPCTAAALSWSGFGSSCHPLPTFRGLLAPFPYCGVPGLLFRYANGEKYWPFSWYIKSTHFYESLKGIVFYYQSTSKIVSTLIKLINNFLTFMIPIISLTEYFISTFWTEIL